MRGEIKALYQRHQHWLISWLQNRLGDSHTATDLTQDVFVRLMSRRAPIAAKQPRAFLRTIAHGLVVDHWRRRDLEQSWLETLAASPTLESPSAEHSLMAFEALVEIDKLLGQLSPTIRKAFLLARLDGLTCPQIAERLNLSRATIERYLARALRQCYKMRFEN